MSTYNFFRRYQRRLWAFEIEPAVTQDPAVAHSDGPTARAILEAARVEVEAGLGLLSAIHLAARQLNATCEVWEAAMRAVAWQNGAHVGFAAVSLDDALAKLEAGLARLDGGTRTRG